VLEELIFRAAQLPDVPSLLKMEQALIESERPFDSALKARDAIYYDLEFLISDPDSYLMVVEAHNKIVGSTSGQLRQSKDCHEHERHCYLGFIYVDPGFRGRGIASDLIEALKAWSVSHGVKQFFLEVYTKNESAIRAYEKAGFSGLSVKMELAL